jgi:hypothetical protein
MQLNETIEQIDLIKLLEEGLLDTQQAILIFEMFQDRLSVNEPKSMLWIFMGWFPVVGFISLMLLGLIIAVVSMVIRIR